MTLKLLSYTPQEYDIEYDHLLNVCNGYHHYMGFLRDGKLIASMTRMESCPRGCKATEDTDKVIPKTRKGEYEPSEDDIAFRQRLDAVFSAHRGNRDGKALLAGLFGALTDHARK